MKPYFLFLLILTSFSQRLLAQKKQTLIINDFENKPATASWWRVNGNVHFSYNDARKEQVNKKSKVCLYIRWDSIPADQPHTWFTDLKADTLAGEGMESIWKQFQQNTWLSFWCKAGDGDSLFLHYLVLSKGHSSKWGATAMIPATSNKWTFYKVRFADLIYEDWGKVKAAFDLQAPIGRCFEVGLRSASISKKGFIEAWFDNIKLTNYEPFE